MGAQLCILRRYSALRKCRNAVSAGVLSPISSAVGRNGAVGDKESARAGARNYPRRRQILCLRRCGGELAFPWRGGGLRRPHFFLRRKKCGKESRLDLRSKGPLARGGQVQIWRCVLAGGVQRSSLSVKRTVPAFTGAEASATACPSHGRGICFYRVGDYQIAPLPPQGGKGRCARRAQDIIIS